MLLGVTPFPVIVRAVLITKVEDSRKEGDPTPYYRVITEEQEQDYASTMFIGAPV